MKHAMAIFIGAAVLAAVLTQPAVGLAQSSDKWVVNKDWAQLPPGMTWDASTSWITPDFKGNIVVLVRNCLLYTSPSPRDS